MKTNMKRQAVGVRRSSDELEDCQTSDNKRIKLVSNDTNSAATVDCVQDKSIEMYENNVGLNNEHGDHSHTIAANGSEIELHMSKQPSESNHSPKNVNENDAVEDENDNLNNSQNGFCDDEVVNASSCDSGIVSELYSADSQDSCVNSDTAEVLQHEIKESETVRLNHANHIDIHNTDSTDSFQSENSEVTKSANISKNQIPKSCSSPEENNCQEPESKVGPDLNESFDIDNLMLSHLEVTQLEGHSDVVFCVAADEDLILSSSGDTTVKVWSMHQRTEIAKFSGHSNSVTSVILLNQEESDVLKKKMSRPEISRIAVTGSLDCNLKVWSVFDGHEIASVYTYNGITCLGYLEPELYIIVGTEGGKLELWDVASSKNIQSIHAHEDSVTDIKVENDYVYSVSTDGTVKVWFFDGDEIHPVYTRKRKEMSQNKTDLYPAQWKTVAVSNNAMYLGDNTNNLKVLDWRIGFLRLFKNQNLKTCVCESVITLKNMLFSTYYDSSSDTAGINVWSIPEMCYICTLTGEVQDICSIAVVQKGSMLHIVSGGHQLLVWDFDFTKPPKKESQDGFYVCELETLGDEIDEKLVDVPKFSSPNNTTASTFSVDHKNSPKKWCNVM